jgi:hypothetical protein
MKELTSQINVQKQSYKEILQKTEYNEGYFKAIPAIKPMDGYYSHHGFGVRIHPILGTRKVHLGLDIVNDVGTPIYSAGDGVVLMSGQSGGGFGIAVVINHGYGYQTVYARVRGSSAAPTAGLHFTDRLLLELDNKGINLCFVTLHVGVDTFMPVQESQPQDHKMYTEFCRVSGQVADALNETRASGHKVIGVGTTSVRTLESSYDQVNNKYQEYADWTNLYILPGQNDKFKSIDGMVTNFHYPRSTNLMMVAALLGLPFLREVYKVAVDNKYRFYSFGDACLIL